MNLAVWAERNGVARVTAYRWFHAGLLPVPARKAGRLILVDDQPADRSRRARTAVYARVSSADQKPDLDRQVARVTAWATTEQIAVDKVVTEVGSALNGHRWWNTETGSAGSALSTSKRRWPPKAASWSWSTRPRLMTTWYGT